MASDYVDDLLDDDEVPELTEADFAGSVPFLPVVSRSPAKAAGPQDRGRLSAGREAGRTGFGACLALGGRTFPGRRQRLGRARGRGATRVAG